MSGSAVERSAPESATVRRGRVRVSAIRIGRGRRVDIPQSPPRVGLWKGGTGAERGGAPVGLGVDAHALEDGVPLVSAGSRSTARAARRPLRRRRDRPRPDRRDPRRSELGDIGSLFPSDGRTPPGVSSLVLLEEAYARVRADGGSS